MAKILAILRRLFFRMRAYVEAKHVITGACECVSAGCWTFRYFAGSPPGRFAPLDVSTP